MHIPSYQPSTFYILSTASHPFSPGTRSRNECENDPGSVTKESGRVAHFCEVVWRGRRALLKHCPVEDIVSPRPSGPQSPTTTFVLLNAHRFPTGVHLDQIGDLRLASPGGLPVISARSGANEVAVTSDANSF
jgi:hypothetical protein